MSDDTTTTPDVKWGVPPRDLPEFTEAQEKLRKARELADTLPAEIADQETFGEAADALKELRHAREDVTALSKAVKGPYDQYGREVLASFRELGSTNDAAEDSIKDRVTKYTAAQKKKADEERKKAERSERERQAREDKKAEEEQRRSRAVKPSTRPAPPPKKASGGFAQTVVKEVTKYEVQDESRIPDEYFDRVLNKGKVAASAKAGLVIPGVRIWKEPQVATR
jgi:hypothetical protein